MRPTLSAVSLVFTSLAAILVSTACATKGFVPRIVSESVIIRTVDDRSVLASATLAPGTPTVQKAAPKEQSTPAHSKRAEPQTTGTVGFTDIEALIAAAFPGFAEKSSVAPAASGTTPNSAPLSKSRPVSIAAGALLVALAFIGALCGAMFYMNRTARGRQATTTSKPTAPSLPVKDQRTDGQPDADLHLAWILGAEDSGKVEDFPTELQLPSARH